MNEELKGQEMKTYYISTDAGAGEVEAQNINDAVADYFDGEIKA